MMSYIKLIDPLLTTEPQHSQTNDAGETDPSEKGNNKAPHDRSVCGK